MTLESRFSFLFVGLCALSCGRGTPLLPPSEACGSPDTSTPVAPSKVVEPPEPESRWSPEEPNIDPELGFGWSTARINDACAHRAITTGVIEGASAFAEVFCLEPELDWSRYRLAVFTADATSAGRPWRVVQVVRNPERWLVIVEPSGPCCADAWDCLAPALAIVPASTTPITFVPRASSLSPCAEANDGYGY